MTILGARGNASIKTTSSSSSSSSSSSKSSSGSSSSSSSGKSSGGLIQEAYDEQTAQSENVPVVVVDSGDGDSSSSGNGDSSSSGNGGSSQTTTPRRSKKSSGSSNLIQQAYEERTAQSVDTSLVSKYESEKAKGIVVETKSSSGYRSITTPEERSAIRAKYKDENPVPTQQEVRAIESAEALRQSKEFAKLSLVEQYRRARELGFSGNYSEYVSQSQNITFTAQYNPYSGRVDPVLLYEKAASEQKDKSNIDNLKYVVAAIDEASRKATSPKSEIAKAALTSAENKSFFSSALGKIESAVVSTLTKGQAQSFQEAQSKGMFLFGNYGKLYREGFGGLPAIAQESFEKAKAEKNVAENIVMEKRGSFLSNVGSAVLSSFGYDVKNLSNAEVKNDNYDVQSDGSANNAFSALVGQSSDSTNNKVNVNSNEIKNMASFDFVHFVNEDGDVYKSLSAASSVLGLSADYLASEVNYQNAVVKTSVFETGRVVASYPLESLGVVYAFAGASALGNKLLQNAPAVVKTAAQITSAGVLEAVNVYSDIVSRPDESVESIIRGNIGLDVAAVGIYKASSAFFGSKTFEVEVPVQTKYKSYSGVEVIKSPEGSLIRPIVEISSSPDLEAIPIRDTDFVVFKSDKTLREFVADTQARQQIVEFGGLTGKEFKSLLKTNKFIPESSYNIDLESAGKISAVDVNKGIIEFDLNAGTTRITGEVPKLTQEAPEIFLEKRTIPTTSLQEKYYETKKFLRTNLFTNEKATITIKSPFQNIVSSISDKFSNIVSKIKSNVDYTSFKVKSSLGISDIPKDKNVVFNAVKSSQNAAQSVIISENKKVSIDVAPKTSSVKTEVVQSRSVPILPSYMVITTQEQQVANQVITSPKISTTPEKAQVQSKELSTSQDKRFNIATSLSSKVSSDLKKSTEQVRTQKQSQIISTAQDLSRDIKTRIDQSMRRSQIYSPVKDLTQISSLRYNLGSRDIQSRIQQEQTSRIPDFNLKLDKSSKMKSNIQAQVKRSGKFQTLSGDFKSVYEATRYAGDFVKGSSAASLRILEDGRVVSPSQLAGFVPSKKDKDVLVEMNKFRINTPGELQEITFKGQQVLRNKIKSFLGKK